MSWTAWVGTGLASAALAAALPPAVGAAVPPGAPVQLAPPNACYSTSAAGGCSAIGDGQTISGAEPIAISADGADLYAGGSNGGGVAFSRSSAGPLTAIGAAGAFGDTSFAIDGAGLFASVRQTGGDNGEVDAYARGGGVPSFVNHVVDNCSPSSRCNSDNGLFEVDGVAAAANGTRVYAASHFGGGGSTGGALTVFSRDPSTEAIGELQCVSQTPTASGPCSVGTGTKGLEGADSIALTPDGRFLYATGNLDQSVLGFNLVQSGPSAGEIGSLVNCLWSQATSTCAQTPGLQGAEGLALSPDGHDLYVAAFNGGIVALHRDQLSGVLSFNQCYTQAGGSGCAADPALVEGGRDVVVSPDGRFVYLVGGGLTDGIVRTYARDPTSGDLTPLACVSYLADPDCSTAAGLLNAAKAAISPDGGFLYVTSFQGGDGNGAVAAFRIQPPPSLPAPVISGAHLSHRRFRVGRRPTVVSAKKVPAGTSFRFTLSESARLQIKITRMASGLRRGHRCVAPTKKLRQAHAKRCKRSVTVGDLTRANEPGGHDSVAFSGRIGRRALRPQRYRATLTAVNGGGSSSPVTLAFTVVR